MRNTIKKSHDVGHRHFALAKLIERVALETKPTDDEIFLSTEYADSIMSRLKSALPIDVEIIMAGSVARGTQIRGSSDIDIFLRFPKTMDERKMEESAIRIAKSIVDKKSEHFIINYAEHPYLKLVQNKSGMSADIVPSFRINDASELASAVDRTPLHNIFINDNLNERQKGEVRALKYLLRQHSIYGAEARIGGFSGYLCELLICTYGNLARMLGSLSDAKLPIVLKPLSKEILYGDAGSGLSKRFDSDFVVVDPTDPNRNVAAAVSKESLSRLVIICRSLLASKKPVVEFYGRRESDERLSSRIEGFKRELGLESCSLIVPVSKISEDTVWPQISRLRKSLETLVSERISVPIMVVQSLHNDEAVITVFMNRVSVGAERISGPSVFIKDGSTAFLKKHSKEILSLSGDRIFAIRRSDIQTIEELIGSLLKDNRFVFPSHIFKKRGRIVKRLPEIYAKPVWLEMSKRFL